MFLLFLQSWALRWRAGWIRPGPGVLRISLDWTWSCSDELWWTRDRGGNRKQQSYRNITSNVCAENVSEGFSIWTPSDCSWIIKTGSKCRCLFTSSGREWVHLSAAVSGMYTFLWLPWMLDLWAHVVSQILPGFKLCASDWGVTTG